MELTIPPPSILKNTKHIIIQCELYEVSIGVDFLLYAKDRNVLDKKQSSFRFVLVTELACLLHIQSYAHARQLWNRYSHIFDMKDQCVFHQPEFFQFFLLWDVAKSIIVNDIENVFAKIDVLQHSLDPNIKIGPLLLYCKELRNSYRDTIVRMLEKYYENISIDLCSHRLGFDKSNHDAMNGFLCNRGWKKLSSNDKFLTPGNKCLSKKKDEGVNYHVTFEENIQSLTEIAEFMERKRLNT